MGGRAGPPTRATVQTPGTRRLPERSSAWSAAARAWTPRIPWSRGRRKHRQDIPRGGGYGWPHAKVSSPGWNADTTCAGGAADGLAVLQRHRGTSRSLSRHNDRAGGHPGPGRARGREEPQEASGQRDSGVGTQNRSQERGQSTVRQPVRAAIGSPLKSVTASGVNRPAVSTSTGPVAPEQAGSATRASAQHVVDGGRPRPGRLPSGSRAGPGSSRSVPSRPSWLNGPDVRARPGLKLQHPGRPW